MELTVKAKRAVVTGAGSGIGRAIAESFHSHGAQVHICDVVDEHLADSAAKLPGIGTTRADGSMRCQIHVIADEWRARGERVIQRLR